MNLTVGGPLTLLNTSLADKPCSSAYSGALAQRNGCFYYCDNRYRHLLNQNFPGVEMETQCTVGQTGSIYIPHMCSYGSAKVRVDTVLTGATAERPFEADYQEFKAVCQREGTRKVLASFVGADDPYRVGDVVIGALMPGGGADAGGAPVPPAVNGACGSTANSCVAGSSAPTANLCSQGAATSAIVNARRDYYTLDEPYRVRSCHGTNGGTTANCSANSKTYNTCASVGDTKSASCAGKPLNTVYNTATSITQTRNGTIRTPTTTATYNTTASASECRYKCASGYHTENSGASCVSNTRTCSITNGQGTQTRNGSSWNACLVLNCNAGYEISGNSCVPASSAPAGLTIKHVDKDLLLLNERGEVMYALADSNL